MNLTNTTRKNAAAQELSNLLVKQPDAVTLSGTAFQNLLNDFCPALKNERFLLGAVHQIQWFTVRLSLRNVDENNISQLEIELRNRLGFERSIARWITHSWARALNITITRDGKFPTGEVYFSCPHCNCTGKAEPYWCGQMAVCPSCKAQIQFDEMLEKTLVKKGWPKRRLKSRKWTIATKVQKSSLETQIDQLIHNGRISVSTAADQLGLPRIVSAFESEIKMILETIDSERLVTGQKHLVHAVLKGFMPERFIHLTPNIPPDSLARMQPLHPNYDEEILGIVTSAQTDELSGLMFGCQNFYYTSRAGTGCVAYTDCNSKIAATDDSIFSFTIGSNHLVCLKGTGVTRRLVMKVLSTLCRCINAAKNHELEFKP